MALLRRRHNYILVDGAVFIPMYGKGRSMNVHISAAIVAYHAMILGR